MKRPHLMISVISCLVLAGCATPAASPTPLPPTEAPTTLPPAAAPTATATSVPTPTAVPTATFDPSTITANPETWPLGFADAAGGNVTSQLSKALREPMRYGLWSTNADKLEEMAIEHPEWKGFIDYVLKTVIVFR